VKKISIVAASAGLVVLMGADSAFASPTGPYIDVMGGAGYVAGSKLDHMEFPEKSGGGNGNAVPWYQSGFDYTGRAAFGYFFNQDPLNSWAFGLEAGYNYFSPVNSSKTTSFTSLNAPYTVKGTTKTNMWSTDLDFVVSEDISENVSLIYKLGVAYESIERSFTATQISGPVDSFNSSEKKDISGFGGLAGIGMQYNFNKNFALRTEIDGMKGGKDIGYAQGLVGLVWSF